MRVREAARAHRSEVAKAEFPTSTHDYSAFGSIAGDALFRVATGRVHFAGAKSGSTK